VLRLDEKKFLKELNDIGATPYVAGGWVRDMFMGRTPYDKDYVICGTDEASFVAKFPEAKKVGSSFPVFLLEIDGKKCEVAFARTERKAGPGYKGFAVSFGPDVTIYDDLYRRDTTMNSMAWSPQTLGLIDPYKGREDIRNRIIRATSEHFVEDPVRALRAARQAAQFEFQIEPRTMEMMRQCRAELACEPKERLLSEMDMALSAPKPSIFFRVLREAGLLETVFPWIFRLIGKEQSPEYHPEGDAFEHAMIVLDDVALLTPRIEVRFAALMHDIGKGMTPDDILPHHYGHEERGLEVLRDMNRVMTLPRRWYLCAEFAIREHMRSGKMTQPRKVVDLLVRLEKHPIGVDGFSAIVFVDNDGEQADCLLNYDRYMRAIKSAHKLEIPKNLAGPQIGEWLRQKEIEAYKKSLSEGT